MICTNFYYPFTGGAETVTRELAEHLSKQHDVSVITRRFRGRKHNNVTVPIFEYTPGDVRVFYNHLEKTQPDVVLIYSDVFDFFRHIITRQNKFRLIVCLCGANWIYTHRSFANVFYRHLDNIDTIVCHSKFDRDYKLCTVHKLGKKTLIIPNGVNLEEFDKNIKQREDLAPKLVDKRWILNVSNFFPGKGQEHLVDILNRLPNPEELAYIQVSSDIDFVIGEQLENKWKKIVGTKLNKKIKMHFAKNVTREDVIGFFKQSNIFAFTTEKEVAPLVLLEAMASKLPWVSMDIGNSRGLAGGKYVPAVKNSKYHSVFDERVSKLFAKAIEELWNSPLEGKRGRIQIEKEMTWEKVLPQYESIIER